MDAMWLTFCLTGGAFVACVEENGTLTHIPSNQDHSVTRSISMIDVHSCPIALSLTSRLYRLR